LLRWSTDARFATADKIVRVLRAPEKKKRALSYYSRIATRYHWRVARGPLSPLRQRERQTVLELARLAPGLTLADVGCGSGYYALEAKRRGLRVCAIDAVPEMLAQLDGHVDEIRLADLDSLFASHPFDRVICAGVLDFVADVEQAFANLCALVAPGGLLVVLAPCAGPGGWLYRAEKALWGLRVNLFEPAWLQERARRYGLRPVEVRRPLPGNLALSATRG
jgi:2-polyprenyl-3-methyl-5-hydroxy-6-metoxy-1,4-benzoquinol methylase